MKHYYEILLALNTQGNKEEETKALLEKIEKIITAEKGTVKETQHLGRKEFSYPHRHLKAAYYLNLIAILEPSAVEKIRHKLSLIEEVTLQNYYKKALVA